jgi:hypothetical protein
MRPVIRLVHSLARSGGTLFSRCLGCMDGVMLFSEVHATVPPPAEVVDQAREWYGVMVPREMDFLSQVDLLAREAVSRGLNLILRDWSHVDFVSCEDPGWYPRNFSMLRELLGTCYDVRSLCLVRGLEDTWRSMLRYEGTALVIVKGYITRVGFERAHEAFGRFAMSVGSVLTYEQLCAAPEETMRRACEELDLSYDPGFVTKWSDYRKVTGDTASFGRKEISNF